MAKAPGWFWYPKDCDTDERVRAMNDQEFGFYMRCLNHAWMNRSIPADPVDLARVLGRTPTYVRRMWKRVGPCFQPHDTLDTRLVNFKQELQRVSQDKFSSAKSAAALSRWNKKPDSDTCNAHAMRVQCLPIAIASASKTLNLCSSAKTADGELPFDTLDPVEAPGKGPNQPGEEPGDFDEFWALYPRRVCKKTARQKFTKARKKHPQALLVAKLPLWTSYWDDPEFIPYPSTFLSREQFLEDPPARSNRKAGTQRSAITAQSISDWADGKESA